MSASPPPGAHTESDRIRPLGALLAVLCVALALGSSALRLVESAAVRGSSTTITVLLLATALAGLASAWASRARPPILFYAGALIAAALVLSGVPELPLFPTIESFGRSTWFVAVLCLVLFFGIRVGALRAARSSSDALLLLFVLFAAFAGPMYVRDANEFHRAFLLLAVVALLALPGRAGRLRDTPFLGLYLLFLAISAAASFSAVDLDRHLAGWTRAAAAIVPLLVLGTGEPDAARARMVLRAFAVTVLAGAGCAFIALLEAGHEFSYRHAFDARLPLFGAHPNIVAPYFSVAPPLLLALLPSARTARGKTLLLVTLALAVTVLGLTRSRAAIVGGGLSIAAFVGFYACVAAYRRRPRASTVGWIVLGALVLVGGAGYAGRRKIAAKLDDPSMKFRVYMWSTAARAIQDRPLTGFGYLSSEPLMKYAEPSAFDGRTKNTHPHALPFAVALGAGIPALVALLLLLGAFALRVLRAAARLGAADERAIAVGVVASALALLSANLLDQGLALNTPLPFHFGILIGVGALMVRIARRAEIAAGAPAAAPPAGRFVPAIARGLAVAIVLVTGVGLVAQRLADLALSQDDPASRDDAARLLDVARKVNPYSLSIGLAYASMLDGTGRRADALDAFRDVETRHPMAWQPWERISVLELDRREELRALQAVKNAQVRDPTGPLAAEWALRAAKLHLRLRQRGSAFTELSNALLTDFHAAERVPWKTAADGSYYLAAPEGIEPIYLDAVLRRNTERMIECSESDPVQARRIATTMAQICVTFRLVSQGNAVIAEFEKRNPPWVSLEVVKADLDRIAAEQAGNVPSSRGGDAALPDESESAEPTPSGSGDDAEDVAGDWGRSGLYYAEARGHLAAGRLEDAVESARRGVEAIYDMVAEREYLRLLVDMAFQGSCKLGDAERARRWFRPALYFNPVPRARLDRCRLLADAERGAGHPAQALAVLRAATALFPRMQPTSADGDTLVRFAATWSALLDDAETREEARAALDAVARDGPGLVLRLALHAERKERAEAQNVLQELKRDHPAWIFEASRR